LATTDGGGTWRDVGVGLPASQFQALGTDPRHRGRLWVVADGRLFRSDDGGGLWESVGRPLPDPPVVARGLAGDRAVAVTTDRGLYWSPDGGERWKALADNLPAHLEAGPLVGDPRDPRTLYAGFALTPYAELWRKAREGGGTLGRVGPWSWAGGAA